MTCQGHNWRSATAKRIRIALVALALSLSSCRAITRTKSIVDALTRYQQPYQAASYNEGVIKAAWALSLCMACGLACLALFASKLFSCWVRMLIRRQLLCPHLVSPTYGRS